MAAMDAAFDLIFSGADAPDVQTFAQDSLASAVAAFTESHASATCSVPRPNPSTLYFGDVAAVHTRTHLHARTRLHARKRLLSHRRMPDCG